MGLVGMGSGVSAELEHFILRYQRRDEFGVSRPPDLSDSLAELSRIHAGLGKLGRLPSPCRCLIEGYAAPRNARSLREYLAANDVDPLEILAVDLYDLPAVYARLGYEIPPLRFVQADARNLGDVVDDHCVHLVVQDFLVNCMPPGEIPALFLEVSRVLAPDGLAFVSFTDDQCMMGFDPFFPVLCPVTEIFQFPIGTSGQDGWLSASVGRKFQDPETGSWVFVTPPYGRLEFFSRLSKTLSDISSSGLEILVRSVSYGQDDHGLCCTRHRCILRRADQQESSIWGC
jgi:hypothetical protein